MSHNKEALNAPCSKRARVEPTTTADVASTATPSPSVSEELDVRQLLLRGRDNLRMALHTPDRRLPFTSDPLVWQVGFPESRSWDPVPLGVGSIGVVYAATDAKGAALAIKVTHALMVQNELVYGYNRAVNHRHVVRALKTTCTSC